MQSAKDAIGEIDKNKGNQGIPMRTSKNKRKNTNMPSGLLERNHFEIS